MAINAENRSIWWRHHVECIWGLFRKVFFHRIWLLINYALIYFWWSISLQNFAHCMTTVLSWHIQKKNCSDMLPYNGVMLKPMFHQIWIMMEKSFVKWARGHKMCACVCVCVRMYVSGGGVYLYISRHPKKVNISNLVCVCLCESSYSRSHSTLTIFLS